MAQFDADSQFDANDLPKLLEPLWRKELDITLGSRFVYGSFRGPGSTPTHRSYGNHLASFYASLWARQSLSDVQAGIKAWTCDAWKRIGIKSNNYSYEAEIAVKGVLEGLRVADVPVKTYGRETGKTNVNVVWDGLRLLRDITLFGLKMK
jgi:hypothetical protein